MNKVITALLLIVTLSMAGDINVALTFQLEDYLEKEFVVKQGGDPMFLLDPDDTLKYDVTSSILTLKEILILDHSNTKTVEGRRISGYYQFKFICSNNGTTVFFRCYRVFSLYGSKETIPALPLVLAKDALRKPSAVQGSIPVSSALDDSILYNHTIKELNDNARGNRNKSIASGGVLLAGGILGTVFTILCATETFEVSTPATYPNGKINTTEERVGWNKNSSLTISLSVSSLISGIILLTQK